MTPEQEKLISDHLYMVHLHAYRIWKTVPYYVELKELKADGMLGLTEAAVRFDPLRGVFFRTFADVRIRGAILDGLRRNDQAGLYTRAQVETVAAAYFDLSSKLGCKPTDEQMAEQLGLNCSSYRRLVVQLAPFLRIALETNILTPDGSAELDQLASDEKTRPDVMCEKSENTARIRSALHEMAPRNQRLFRSYYHEGRTFREIAKDLGITEGRVSQLHKDGLRKLKSHFSAQGIRARAAA